MDAPSFRSICGRPCIPFITFGTENLPRSAARLSLYFCWPAASRASVWRPSGDVLTVPYGVWTDAPGARLPGVGIVGEVKVWVAAPFWSTVGAGGAAGAPTPAVT